jgi:predicted  nucleic acid-binding Zn-ribbon protein
MKNSCLKAISEQEERLKSLNGRRQDQLQQLDQLTADYLSVQQTFHDKEKQLKTSEQQASRLKDIGGDEAKIKAFTAEAAKHEDELFGLMEKSELLQTEMVDTKTFLQGLETTYQDIKQEVDAGVKEQRTEIGRLETRIQLLEAELPDDFKNLLERTKKKNLAVGIFTKNESGSCYFCRFKISKNDESEIDMLKLLKTCPQCSRIFLPYGS